VVERLRALAERPLDPRAGRAVIVLAAAIFAGLALLVMLAGATHDRAPRERGDRVAHPAPAGPLPRQAPLTAFPRQLRGVSARRRGRPMQDPQDRHGSAAARRAMRELSSHRALQHVPYRHGVLSIVLIGARGRRALLEVSAPTLAAASRGWRRFLRRYGDAGRTYLPLFRDRRRREGAGA
jgi:hypothetical protein